MLTSSPETVVGTDVELVLMLGWIALFAEAVSLKAIEVCHPKAASKESPQMRVTSSASSAPASGENAASSAA